VGNLPYSITESDLAKAFSEYGSSNVRIVEGRGFGFVDIEAEKLTAAIADKNNTELGGRTLTVNEARPKEARPSGGGGDRYSGGGGGGGGRSRGGNRW
jgi:RNA recognition motif-containing protein